LGQKLHSAVSRRNSDYAFTKANKIPKNNTANPTMKKQLMSLAATLVFAGSVFGQGQVTLGNNASSLVRITDPVAGTPVPVGSISFQLYYGPAGTPAANLIPAPTIAGTSAALAGRIANTAIDIPTTGQNSVPWGGAATFQIWAWTSSFASYSLAASGGGLIGKSATFNANTSPDPAGGPPPLPTALAGLYPGFAVAVPEPSTFALAGLGAAGLLLFRRFRK
jgi:hypothetical protein